MGWDPTRWEGGPRPTGTLGGGKEISKEGALQYLYRVNDCRGATVAIILDPGGSNFEGNVCCNSELSDQF